MHCDILHIDYSLRSHAYNLAPCFIGTFPINTCVLTDLRYRWKDLSYEPSSLMGLLIRTLHLMIFVYKSVSEFELEFLFSSMHVIAKSV